MYRTPVRITVSVWDPEPTPAGVVGVASPTTSWFSKALLFSVAFWETTTRSVMFFIGKCILDKLHPSRPSIHNRATDIYRPHTALMAIRAANYITNGKSAWPTAFLPFFYKKKPMTIHPFREFARVVMGMTMCMRTIDFTHLLTCHFLYPLLCYFQSLSSALCGLSVMHGWL